MKIKDNTINANKQYGKEIDNLKVLQKNIRYKFNNQELLIQALTHKSYSKSNNNERLEFLGDAVLDLIIGEYVFTKLPKSNEGELTKLRASLVNETSFATIARYINLGEYLFISNAESRNNGRDKPSILSNALEALIGAVYLDSNIDNTKSISYRLVEMVYHNIQQELPFNDYKTTLQELTQSICGSIPEYKVIDSTGPDHNKTFRVEILINGMIYATETGRSKKSAEQACAKVAYMKLKMENNR